MKKEMPAVLLRIFVGESDKHEGKELYEFFVEYLREHHFSGVTVLRGLEGFGHAHLIHTANLVDLSTDLPIVIEVIDTYEKIETLKVFLDTLPQVSHMLITEEKITIVRYEK